MKINFISLHSVDITLSDPIKRDIKLTDAEYYIKGLIKKLIENKNKREYETNEVSFVSNCIKSMVNFDLSYSQAAVTTTLNENNDNTDYPEIFINQSNLIAKKLYIEQLKAQEKYKFTEIKNGGLVQALAKLENNYVYIICFIDHSSFIDENDLLEKIGLPKDKATLKSSIFYLSEDCEFTDIYLSDSRPKITEYWYDAFLEVKETRNNITNTKNAYKHITTILSNKLSSKHKADYIQLKNIVDVYFLQSETFELDTCLDFVFDQYQPNDENLDLNSIKSNIKENSNVFLKFDSNFGIDTSEIKTSLINRKIQVTDNLELKIKTPKENLKDYLYSTKIDGDIKVLIIKNISEQTFKLFNQEEKISNQEDIIKISN